MLCEIHPNLSLLSQQEKEEQKRQAEQQAMMHRRDGVPPPVGPGPDQGNMGQPGPHPQMGMRLEHPGMRMPGPPDAAGQGWGPGMDPGQPAQFQQGRLKF